MKTTTTSPSADVMPRLHCKRCHVDWIRRTDATPTLCPRCKSHDWQEPYTMDRSMKRKKQDKLRACKPCCDVYPMGLLARLLAPLIDRTPKTPRDVLDARARKRKRVVRMAKYAASKNRKRPTRPVVSKRRIAG